MPTDLPPTLPVELHAFDFLAGSWGSARGAEYWVAAGDVWYAVSFFSAGSGERYEVARIVLQNGQPVFLAQPDGGRPVPFPVGRTAPDEVVFDNPHHDDPQQIRYARSGARLRAWIGDGTHERQVLRARSREATPIDALVDADRTFYADVARGGVDAWIAWFDVGGSQWDEDEDRRVTPHDGIREMITPTLQGRLWWDPIASGLSPTGRLGFTVGDWTWTPPGGTEPVARGAYVTVWRQQADGSWKVWFDGGDPIDP